MNRIFFTIIAIILCTVSSYSQVTIGSMNPPVEGALLDLKESVSSGTENAQKGFLLPRVNLTVKNSLIDISDVDYNDANVALMHTGLTVYNMNAGFEGGVGINVWDGTEWTNLNPQETTFQVSSAPLAKPKTSLVESYIDKDNSGKVVSFPKVEQDSNDEYDVVNGIHTVKNNGNYNIAANIKYNRTKIKQN